MHWSPPIAPGGSPKHEGGRRKEEAVLVSLDDYARLRELEDREDLEAMRKSKAVRGKIVDWEDLKAECGL